MVGSRRYPTVPHRRAGPRSSVVPGPAQIPHRHAAAMRTIDPCVPPPSFGIVGSVRLPVSPDGPRHPSSRPFLAAAHPRRRTRNPRGLVETTSARQGQPLPRPWGETWSCTILDALEQRADIRLHCLRDYGSPPVASEKGGIRDAPA